MSVTVTIVNGEEYVRENCPEKIHVEVFPADVQFPDGYRMEYLPYELNMANGNFHTVFCALGVSGIEFDYVGEIEPRKLLKAIQRTHQDLFVRATQRTLNIINCGIGREQADNYISKLVEICEEAIKREEKVCWG